MSKNRQLVVFARAPRLGNGKTRLAHDIGAGAAHRFYEACLGQLLQNSAGGPWELLVAVASKDDRSHPIFQDHPLMTQIQGDLGQRMKNVLINTHQHHTLVVGSDIPELRPHHLNTAFDALDAHDLVFGPATDGGFWSIGCRQGLELPETFLQNVRWSTSFALEDSLASIPKNLTVALVDTLSDVDDAVNYYENT